MHPYIYHALVLVNQQKSYTHTHNTQTLHIPLLHFSMTYFSHSLDHQQVQDTSKCYGRDLPFTINLMKYIKYYSQ